MTHISGKHIKVNSVNVGKIMNNHGFELRNKNKERKDKILLLKVIYLENEVEKLKQHIEKLEHEIRSRA